MFLGFVGVPPTPIPYPVFTELATGTGFGASTLRAAATVATGAIVRQGAALLGAGALGFWVGQKILENLEYTGPAPTVRQLYKTPSNVGNIRVITDFKLIGGPTETGDNIFPSPIVGPVSFVSELDVISYGLLVGPNATFQGFNSAARSLIERPLTITSVTKVDGSALPGVARVPSYPTDAPYVPYKVPTTVPVLPGVPDFPITPEIVPYTPETPFPQDETREPGVIVQIPELGLQLRFTPTGVAIGSYSSPSTKPFEIPQAPPPVPPKKVAIPPCPCPEDEPENDEVLCRVKKLQEELLDDGYTSTATFVPAAQSIRVAGLGEGFHKLSINVVSSPLNATATQYAAPAPPVYHCGWYAWLVDGDPSDRLPIQTKQSSYTPPEGANGFIMALNDAFIGSAAYYIRTKKPYVDNC